MYKLRFLDSLNSNIEKIKKGDLDCIEQYGAVNKHT